MTNLTPSSSWQEAFILNTQTAEKGGKEYVQLWLKTESGTKLVETQPQYATAFVETSHQVQVNRIANHLGNIQLTNSHLHTFQNQPVLVVKADTQRALREFESRCNQEEIRLFESDIKLADRYVMERFVYGSVQFQTNPQLRIRPGVFKPKLSFLSIDIECDEHGELYSIGCDDGENGWVWMRDPEHQTIAINHFKYIAVDDENALLKCFTDFVINYDPDVLLGWNVKQFDCRILVERAKALGIALNIGRDKSVMTVRQTQNDQYWVNVSGRAVVDGIESLKTMTYHFPSFALDSVAEAILDKRKLVHEVDQLAAIKRLFKEDKGTLANYNWQDCRLVADIAKKTNLLDFLVLRSCLTGLPISRPGGSVAAFINTYLPHAHRAGYVAPRLPEDGGLASPGGYVMTSSPGMYKNILVLDFKSLYPSIIRTFLIDPVGLVEGLKLDDETKTIAGFKGARFSRETHFLPQIIDQLWQQRDEAKKTNDEVRSRAIKIIMNSFYGVLGSGGCPFYDTRLASSITLRGHKIMQTTKRWIEAMGYKVIYGDTDSTFVWLEHCSDTKEANKIGTSLAKQINKKWQQHIHQHFNTECHLEIEFETHFSRFFMPTIRDSELGSKKRYAGLTGDLHGKKLVFKGLESVRSDWTQLAKEFQTQLYALIFADQKVEDFIISTVNNIRSGNCDEKLIYKRRLRKPVEAYTKTRPPHVKAAAMANQKAMENGTPIPYPSKSTVSYVLTINGPQPAEDNVQLDVDHYIQKQIRPIAESILPHVGLSFDKLTNQQMQLF